MHNLIVCLSLQSFNMMLVSLSITSDVDDRLAKADCLIKCRPNDTRVTVFVVQFGEKMYRTCIHLGHCTISSNVIFLSSSTSTPCGFSAGALVWAKLEGHPWWPCMVVPQPLSGQQMRGKGRNQRIHVHFFDEPPTRGWVSTKYVREYHGEIKFKKILMPYLCTFGLLAVDVALMVIVLPVT